VHFRFAKENAAYKAYTENLKMESNIDAVQDALPSQVQNIVTQPLRFESTDVSPNSNSVSYYSELLKQRITQLLATAKNQTMLVEDLMTVLVSTHVEWRLM
jgi:hypothetical protein